MPLTQINQATQCRFLLDAQAFEAFNKALKTSPIDKNSRLKKLLNRPSRWSL